MKVRFLSALAARCAQPHLAIGMALVAISMNAFAVLGGSEASVQADRTHMQASLKITPKSAYTVHELTLPSGTIVREYAANGTVFAVAWEGPWPPDLEQLMGSYFQTYHEAVLARSGNNRGRKPVNIELPGLVARMGGHPRFFKGHAYVPEQMPQGVKEEEIR